MKTHRPASVVCAKALLHGAALLTVLAIPTASAVMAQDPAATQSAAATQAATVVGRMCPFWDGKESQAQYAKRAGMKDAELTLDLGKGVKMKLILIPAGKFMMGKPADCKIGTPGPCNPQPQHEVTITRPFYMGVTEVTQGQYQQITGTSGGFKRAVNMTPETARKIATGEKVEYTPDPNLPMDFVNWQQIAEALKAASGKLGLTVKLPTEAEWEYAYRAGTTTDFYWGEDASHKVVGQYAWFLGNEKEYGGGVKPVGLKKPNAWGLYDMAGNAIESCADTYVQYPSEPQTDPLQEGRSYGRIIRGGYFGNHPAWCTAWHRKAAPETYQLDVLGKWKGRFSAGGFRVVVPVEDVMKNPPAADRKTATKPTPHEKKEKGQ